MVPLMMVSRTLAEPRYIVRFVLKFWSWTLTTNLVSPSHDVNDKSKFFFFLFNPTVNGWIYKELLRLVVYMATTTRVDVKF